MAASLAGAQDDLHSRVVHANDAIDDETVALAGRLYGEVTERRVAVLRVATRLCPYGLVRPYVGGELPEWAEDACLAAGRAIAELGR
ncbi:hypothetical protein ACSDQ9_09485 [Aestuariimicrobium soli]|uniref:hypothetical protein n=1 Tax=Aestuariimicrobium soli TaxID=2035834 RepID=UPI003EBE3D51